MNKVKEIQGDVMCAERSKALHLVLNDSGLVMNLNLYHQHSALAIVSHPTNDFSLTLTLTQESKLHNVCVCVGEFRS